MLNSEEYLLQFLLKSYLNLIRKNQLIDSWCVLDLLNFVPINVRLEWCSRSITMEAFTPTPYKTFKIRRIEYTPADFNFRDFNYRDQWKWKFSDASQSPR